MVKNITISLMFVSAQAQISFTQEGSFPFLFQVSPSKNRSVLQVPEEHFLRNDECG